MPIHESVINYELYKAAAIRGRYVTTAAIRSCLFKPSSVFKAETVGSSVQQKPIEMLTLGGGPIHILMWSQMHGNESTTTKAILDFLNFMESSSVLAAKILEKCTIKIIPILNPDGALAYTRVNANGVDLNRDAQERTQPESKVLRKIFDSFGPDYAFNLHDQRTIFNVGQTPKPATVSFLAPAHDDVRSISKTRAISMQLIVAMNEGLQELIPGQVGRFDDTFNKNCVGDCFQMLQTPTILFEAGHTANDYEREKTREYIFHSICKAVEVITTDTVGNRNLSAYFDIPENNTLFFDVLIKEVHMINPSYEKGSSIGILYKEVLQDGKILFEPYIAQRGKLEGYFGHKTFNCNMSEDVHQLNEVYDALVDLIC
jgi:hypothetical protein